MSDTPPPGSRLEKLFARIAVLQTVMTAIAVVVSVIALYAALVEADSVRRQQDASVWPLLEFAGEITNSDDQRSISFTITNKGIGPARVRSMRAMIRGAHVTSWKELIDAVSGNADATWSSSGTNGTVVIAGETRRWFLLDGEDQKAVVDALADAFVSGEVTFEACYCSVFGECWRRASNELDPREAADCRREASSEFLG